MMCRKGIGVRSIFVKKHKQPDMSELNSSREGNMINIESIILQ